MRSWLGKLFSAAARHLWKHVRQGFSEAKARSLDALSISYKSLSMKLERYKTRLHYRFPNIKAFKEPEMVEHDKRRDAEANPKTKIPDGEELKVHAFWAVELYGPSDIGGLYDALEKLGWANAGRQDMGLSEWISRQRMYGYGGSHSIGMIVRPGEKRFILPNRECEFPAAFSYLHGEVYQITTSLTAVLMRFVMEETEVQKYASAVNTDAATRLEKRQGQRGYTIVDVHVAKRRAVSHVREHYRALAATWFRVHLPGYFSSNVALDGFPTAELCTTRKTPLLIDSESKEAERWTEIVRGRYWLQVWKAAERQGLSIAWPDGERAPRHHALIHFEENSATEEDLRHGPLSSGSLSGIVEQHVGAALVYHAILAKLYEVMRGLRLARDQIPSRPNTRQQVLEGLARIQRFFGHSVGTPTVAGELKLQSEDALWFHWEFERFDSVPQFKQEQSQELSKALASRVSEVAKQALLLDKETREHLEQLSAVLNTQESIRAQQRMERLTVVAMVLSVASLLAALMALDRFSKMVDELVETLWTYLQAFF